MTLKGFVWYQVCALRSALCFACVLYVCTDFSLSAQGENDCHSIMGNSDASAGTYLRNHCCSFVKWSLLLLIPEYNQATRA